VKKTAFTEHELKTGLMFDYSNNQYPTRLHGLVGDEQMSLKSGSTYYLYVDEGTVWVDGLWPVLAGMYASVTRGFLSGNKMTKAIIIERIGQFGTMMVGGPIEVVGRLKYIDGCTDSLLVPPVMKGDPCLNHLHFPVGIDQTSHTHPSMRVGMVTKGRGECVTPHGTYELRPGMAFIIHEDGEHKFRTSSECMDVVAFHPNSDFGPTDEEHPMLNMTFVDGTSAKHLEEIKTK
jgi:hypothetical protein